MRKVLNTETSTTRPPRNGGVVGLLPLYDFARKHKGHPVDGMTLGRTPLGKDYCQECAKLTNNVAESKGFYLWGMFDRKRYWHSIYLGKAGFGKASSLKKRICEELKDERAFLWRAFLDEPQVLRVRDAIHLGRNYSWRCALGKWGATHIVWASAKRVKDGDIKSVEADLIEALDPIANVQRKTPPSKHQHHAVDIFETFRKHVHAARQGKAVLSQSQEHELLQRLGRM